MNKLILIFLFLGILGFSKDETLIKEKKYLRGKENSYQNFLSKKSMKQKLKI